MLTSSDWSRRPASILLASIRGSGSFHAPAATACSTVSAPTPALAALRGMYGCCGCSAPASPATSSDRHREINPLSVRRLLPHRLADTGDGHDGTWPRNVGQRAPA